MLHLGTDMKLLVAYLNAGYEAYACPGLVGQVIRMLRHIEGNQAVSALLPLADCSPAAVLAALCHLLHSRGGPASYGLLNGVCSACWKHSDSQTAVSADHEKHAENGRQVQHH